MCQWDQIDETIDQVDTIVGALQGNLFALVQTVEKSEVMCVGGKEDYRLLAARLGEMILLIEYENLGGRFLQETVAAGGDPSGVDVESTLEYARRTITGPKYAMMEKVVRREAQARAIAQLITGETPHDA